MIDTIADFVRLGMYAWVVVVAIYGVAVVPITVGVLYLAGAQTYAKPRSDGRSEHRRFKADSPSS